MNEKIIKLSFFMGKICNQIANLSNEVLNLVEANHSPYKESFNHILQQIESIECELTSIVDEDLLQMLEED